MNDNIMVEYKKIFGYADTIIFNYLKSGKNLDRFRHISMDYDDVKQEVYIELLKAIEKYDKEYKDVEKVYLEPHVKNLCFFTMNKLLRDNKAFLPVDMQLQEEMGNISDIIKPDRINGMKTINPMPKKGEVLIYCLYCGNCDNEEIVEVEGEEISEAMCSLCSEWRLVEDITCLKPTLHPDLISGNIYKKTLNEDEIKKIIRSCDLSEIDCQVLELRLIYNYTLAQIQEETKLLSEQAVHYKLKAGINKLKKKYKSIPELFEK